MHRIDGIGFGGGAPIGGCNSGGSDIQGVDQDWSIERAETRESAGKAPGAKSTSDIAGRRAEDREHGCRENSFVMHGARVTTLISSRDVEIAALVDLSVRLGRDPLLVQASNGNTSIKIDGVLWVKSSGKWLANARDEELLVPIRLKDVRESVANNREIAWGIGSGIGGERRLRPSIETAMHGVLRHRVVIHVHSVNAIAWAIRVDGVVRLKERLAGLKWRWIPYVGSGIPLARRIEMGVADAPETDVLVLGNHGLVICGDDCDAAEALLREVERRLAVQPREFFPADIEALKSMARDSQWRLPELDALHALGTDGISRKILGRGILYPCQAIFLGATMPISSRAAVVSDARGQRNRGDKNRSFVVVEDGGVLIDENMTSIELANLIGLMEVIQRTEEGAPIRYLTAAEVRGVLDDRAYSYKAVAMRSEKARGAVFQRMSAASASSGTSGASGPAGNE
jgi:ribulose-5-phosphate 4-epimerase/fuculose-1-phosphate aldolase